MATFNITSIVNYSAAAEQRREEALRGLALPMEGGYVRGVVPREYLRVHAEAEAAVPRPIERSTSRRPDCAMFWTVPL